MNRNQLHRVFRFAFAIVFEDRHQRQMPDHRCQRIVIEFFLQVSDPADQLVDVFQRGVGLLRRRAGFFDPGAVFEAFDQLAAQGHRIAGFRATAQLVDRIGESLDAQAGALGQAL